MRWQDKRLCALPILGDKLQSGTGGANLSAHGKIKDSFHLFCSRWSEISCLFPYPPKRWLRISRSDLVAAVWGMTERSDQFCLLGRMQWGMEKQARDQMLGWFRAERAPLYLERAVRLHSHLVARLVHAALKVHSLFAVDFAYRSYKAALYVHIGLKASVFKQTN